MYQAQPYIQLEEAGEMFRQPVSRPRRRRRKTEAISLRPLCRQPGLQTRCFQESAIPELPVESILSFTGGWQLTPLKLPIQNVFGATNGQPWVKRPEPKQHDPARPGAKDYCSFHDCKGHRTAQCRSLCMYLEDLVQQEYLRRYVCNAPNFCTPVVVWEKTLKPL